MKVVCVQQPWATAILQLGKDVENRTLRTTYRGPLAIHATMPSTQSGAAEALGWMLNTAKTVGFADYMNMMIAMPSRSRRRGPRLPVGCIFGVVELVDVVQDSASPWAMPGHYHWLLANPRIVEPVDIKGRLGLWDYAGDLVPRARATNNQQPSTTN